MSHEGVEPGQNILLKKRTSRPKAYDRWADQGIERLKQSTHSKLTSEEIAHEPGRQLSAIESRLTRLIPAKWTR